MTSLETRVWVAWLVIIPYLAESSHPTDPAHTAEVPVNLIDTSGSVETPVWFVARHVLSRLTRVFDNLAHDVTLDLAVGSFITVSTYTLCSVTERMTCPSVSTWVGNARYVSFAVSVTISNVTLQTETHTTHTLGVSCAPSHTLFSRTL